MSRESRRRQYTVASERWATIVLYVNGTTAATWDLTGIGLPTLATVDALARLKLDACRLGWKLTVDGPAPALAELLEFVGLAD